MGVTMVNTKGHNKKIHQIVARVNTVVIHVAVWRDNW